MTEATFTLAQAMQAQKVLRAALGLGEESFPMPALIGMLSDEIEQLRQAGRSDADVTGLIAGATGQPVTTDDLARFYAPPAQRGRPG